MSSGREPPEPDEPGVTDANEDGVDVGLPEAVLQGWMPVQPGDGFVDRVMAARAARRRAPVASAIGDAETVPAGITAPAADRRRPRWRQLRVIWWLAACLAAAAALSFYASKGPRGRNLDGAITATARQSHAIGQRATAVLEAGAVLAYTVRHVGDGGPTRVRVEQTAGDVFYRVDTGTDFEVATPAGRARVRGTCFRVEVVPMNGTRQWVRQTAVGAAVGAAVAMGVVVTVYEGRVALANTHGETELAFGERATMVADHAPFEAEDALPPSNPHPATGGNGSAAGALSAPEPALPTDADAASLRAQNERLRAGWLAERQGRNVEIGALRARLAEHGDDDEGGPRGAFYPPDPDLMVELASRCALRIDQPPIMGMEPGTVGHHRATLDLRDEEVPVIDDAIRRAHRRLSEGLSRLYVEATGDAEGVSHLSPRAMLAEIQDKALEGEVARVMRAISQERAGLAPSGDGNAQMSVAERALRLYAQSGDDFQAIVAQTLGPERAHALRAMDRGWPWSRSEFAGCNR